jgi:hypothetical protein
LVRFDTHLLQHPTIEGLMYQRGTLFGTELRHYLLAKWEHRCAYCQATGVPLEIDHVVPQSRGGNDRVSNLVIACCPCNQRKGEQSLEDFLADRREVLARVQAQRKAPLKDTAAVNSTRWTIYERLKAMGLPVETGSGGLTKWNRQKRALPKTHWVDAVCCGASTPEQLRLLHVRPWLITASGRQRRQMRNVDKHGFPVGKPKGPSRVRGFRTGDLVKAICPPHLKAKGVHVGRVLVRTRGIFDVQTKHGRVERYSCLVLSEFATSRWLCLPACSGASHPWLKPAAPAPRLWWNEGMITSRVNPRNTSRECARCHAPIIRYAWGQPKEGYMTGAPLMLCPACGLGGHADRNASGCIGQRLITRYQQNISQEKSHTPRPRVERGSKGSGVASSQDAEGEAGPSMLPAGHGASNGHGIAHEVGVWMEPTTSPIPHQLRLFSE